MFCYTEIETSAVTRALKQYIQFAFLYQWRSKEQWCIQKPHFSEPYYTIVYLAFLFLKDLWVNCRKTQKARNASVVLNNNKSIIQQIHSLHYIPIFHLKYFFWQSVGKWIVRYILSCENNVYFDTRKEMFW